MVCVNTNTGKILKFAIITSENIEQIKENSFKNKKHSNAYVQRLFPTEYDRKWCGVFPGDKISLKINLFLI